ncbi:unnamed protein product [Phytophthora fragariaefolia]|uniref:Unnamed protein product n=1 Tax=Phytophthora fragariaefolia TaxID=1490495 RepID=A0A9W7D133_9STRA|nr:unnamed protein product [Phytophthora fragariaefolia]
MRGLERRHTPDARRNGLQVTRVEIVTSAGKERAENVAPSRDGLDITSPDEIQGLRTLNRLGEVVRPRTDHSETPGLERPTTPSADAGRTTAPMLPVTTWAASAHAASPRTGTPEVLKELVVQRIQLDRARTAQGEERWTANLKRYLRGELGSLSKREPEDYRNITPQYEEGESGLLYNRTRGDESAEDRDEILKLVIAEMLQDDVLPHYHASMEGGPKASDERISASGDTSTGWASSRAFRAMLENTDGQETTSDARIQMAPQNAWSKRYPSGQDVHRRHRNGDEYTERLTFALNTAHDRTRDETPFYLVHGWDAPSMLEATLSIGNTSHRDANARRWRMRIQRHYKMARAQALELVQEAVAERARRHNEGASQHSIETGSQVWMYLDLVKPGYARKLAHMWHGPFRVAEQVNAFAVRLETAGTPYQLFPIVHISKLMPVREFPTRPATQLTVPADKCFDLDEELLPADSWDAQGMEDDVFEVEKILDVREGRATRYDRTRREFEVKWKGYLDATWVDETDLT